MGIQQTATVEVEGISYTAKYSITDGVVTVTALGPDGTTETNSNNTGGSGADVIAGILLREMVEAGRVIPD